MNYWLTLTLMFAARKSPRVAWFFKRPCVYVFITLLSLGPALAQNPTSAGNSAQQPRIGFASKVLDLGSVVCGKEVRGEFVLTNLGSRTLEIREVKSTCGCTVVSGWPRTLPVNQKGSVAVKFQSGGVSGEVVKHLQVVSNDPVDPRVDLTIKAKVWRPVDFHPAMLNLSIIHGATNPVIGRVQITNHLGHPIGLSQPKTGSAAFEATLRTNTPGQSFELQVKLAGDGLKQTAVFPVTLKTSEKEFPALSLTVVASVVPPLGVMPESIVVSPWSTKVLPGVTIRNNLQGPCTLSNAVCDLPGTTVTIKALTPGRLFRVDLHPGDPGKAVASLPGTLTVSTGNPEFPILQIPVVSANVTYGKSVVADGQRTHTVTRSETTRPRTEAPSISGGSSSSAADAIPQLAPAPRRRSPAR